MYRIVISLAFLVFCSAAPFADVRSSQSFPLRHQQQDFAQQQQQQDFAPQQQQQDFIPQQQQQDFIPQQQQQQDFAQQHHQQDFAQQHHQRDFVPQRQDFAQQSQQQTSFVGLQQQQQQQQPEEQRQSDDSELVDTLGAGYSYFRKQPIGSRPLVQQKLAINEQPASISSLDDTADQWADYTKASAFTPEQIQKPKFTHTIDRLGDRSGQQQVASQGAMDMISTLTQDSLQQPIRSSVSSGYGGQQEDIDLRINSMQKTLLPQQISGFTSGNDQDQEQGFQSHFQQQQLPSVQPLIRNFGSGYGQQQQDVQTLLPQRPFTRTFGGSYGQQLDKPIISVKTVSGYGQQSQPAFNDLTQGYGQQVQQPLIQPTIKTVSSGYGQQVQQPLIQPTIKTVSSGYGQQSQPSFNDLTQGFGQQVQQSQPAFNDLTQDFDQQVQQPLIQPTIKTMSSGYGQQVQQPLIQPTLKTISSGYGQQVQQPLIQPTLRTISSGYGQQQLTQQPLALRTNTGYGQQVQQPLIQPTLRTVSSGYGQQPQQSDLTSIQTMADLPQSSSFLMTPSIMTLQNQQTLPRVGHRGLTGY